MAILKYLRECACDKQFPHECSLKLIHERDHAHPSIFVLTNSVLSRHVVLLDKVEKKDNGDYKFNHMKEKERGRCGKQGNNLCGKSGPKGHK